MDWRSEILNAEKLPAKKIIPQHRRLMATKKPGNTANYVYRAGHNAGTANYTQGTITRISGSSLNRKFNEKSKLERQAANITNEKIKAFPCVGPGRYAEIFQAVYDELLADKKNQQKHKRKIPGLLGRDDLQFPVQKNNRTKDEGNRMSRRTKTKVRDRITSFFRALKDGSFTMMTLTFIDDVEHKQAVKILNSFLTSFRAICSDKKHTDLKYLWVAELQKENNNRIHFHIVINRRIDIKRINALWVITQYNHGLTYMDKKTGKIYSLHEIRQRHEKSLSEKKTFKAKSGTIEEILNPVDVEKINTIYGLGWYLTKYITKNNDKTGFQCLTWHCSRVVSKLFTRSIVSRSTFSNFISPKNQNYYKGKRTVGKLYKGPFHLYVGAANKQLFLDAMNEVDEINAWILDGFEPDKIPTVDDDDIKKFYFDEILLN
jgi:hypothetical protein